MLRASRNVLVLSLVMMAAILAPLAACGGSAHEKTLQVSFVALNATRDGFTEWSRDHQEQIVEHATSADEAKTKVAAFRATRTKVVDAFLVAYAAFSLATLDPAEPNYLEAIKAGKALLAAIKDLKAVAP